MKIILATGIYPPDIGGPATYVKALAAELLSRGEEVIVITYGTKMESGSSFAKATEGKRWIVESVPKSIPFIRWWKYAKALKKYGSDADVVIAFSSVSCGVPLRMAKLTKPKKILRLGGDFLWERYTDRGGMKSLREWYGEVTGYWLLVTGLMMKLLNAFDHIVFSTWFQEEIYEKYYQKLPTHSVLENALPSGIPQKHERHEPFRLLFMGRFVGFKNLPTLITAVNNMKRVSLTLVGDGPVKSALQKIAGKNILFRLPVHGDEKNKVFAKHDLLIIPSITEISPNVALEARSCGLPVLLTRETGLSDDLTQGMIVKDLSTSGNIVIAIKEVMDHYEGISQSASKPGFTRGWREVAQEWWSLIS